ncbi:putative sexual development activator [Rosellinia necatrix]|uniref:Putative sexual development activator n=1 Tax=Rosellinia necatrix TaxID=77044 RepID=A0A1W2TNY2_ROSNE|nr:putative sexual development activator [Rosellinia necatrix]
MLSIQPDSNLVSMMAAPESRMGKTQPCAYERRITKDGRQLWYQLEVLQQPERARACGSGPKSSADRRPVDPPPVVILRVLEGEDMKDARDITFDYNVDFFCYASLEHARPMAHGRVQTPAATSPPVLTGFPVSGCCYLDRPDPAGYFLFPDLSVRHEGRYRLVFSLYELIKNEGDLDRDAPELEPGAVQLPTDACHRMDLRSADFTVFSAKKFPGLTESTSLSRTVAEQGCRVRIRRDVRMRRRDTNTKPAGTEEYSNNAEEEYAKRRGTRTPDEYRARSMSNSSIDRASYPDRRPSNVEYATAPPIPAYQSTKSSGALLNFGQSATGFVQPSYGSMSASNPQSTPVSPAQTVFPPGPNLNLPPPSPSYSGPVYPPFEQSEPENKRLSNSYPLISAKPLRGVEPRSSISSNVSMENTPRPILPSISFPTPSDLPAYSEYSPAYQLKGGLYPQMESRQVKRSADESFTQSQQQMRDIRGDRLPIQPQQVYTPASSYIRADGKRAYAPQHLWLP